jgi:hypothetical protein
MDENTHTEKKLTEEPNIRKRDVTNKRLARQSYRWKRD